jgi:hypothetical protein
LCPLALSMWLTSRTLVAAALDSADPKQPGYHAPNRPAEIAHWLTIIRLGGDGQPVEFALGTGRKAMEWFSRKTPIAGVQISNWMIVLGAVIVVLLIYNSMH